MTNSEKEEAAREKEFEQLLERYVSAQTEGRFEEAEATALEFLGCASEGATAEGRFEDFQLWEEVGRCRNDADWSGAETAYRRVLAFAEKESNWEALEVAFRMQSKVHQNLCAFYALIGEDAAALQEAEAATAAARRGDSKIILCMALEQQAWTALRVGRAGAALAAISEALKTLSDEPIYDLARARTLVARARCRVDLNDLPSADQDLAAAWGILEPRSIQFFAAGVHDALANWWEVTAQLRVLRGNHAGAATAWREAVSRRRQVAGWPQVGGDGPYVSISLAKSLHGLSECLRVAGDVSEAEEALKDSQAIRSKIGLPLFSS